RLSSKPAEGNLPGGGFSPARGDTARAAEGTVMQLAVTVVWPVTRRQADVVINAGPATAVAEIAAELDCLMHGATAAVAAVPALFVGWHQVPGDMRLADSPIMDGCLVSLGDPAGCRRPEPAGVAELRVAGGPAAGSLYRLAFGRVDVGGL